MVFTEVKRKLHPKRFPDMSPKMGAIVGCILGVQCTSPVLVGITITSDNCVLAMRQGDCGFNEFIGAKSDLERNWANLLDAAGLNEGEKAQAGMLYSMALIRGARL